MKGTARVRAVEQFYDNRLFDGVDVHLIERIAPKVGVQRKKPGEIIFREGEPSDSIFMVGRGSVRIAKLGEGIDHEIVEYVDQGNFFGAMALLTGEPHLTTATAAEPAVIGEVSEARFRKFWNCRRAGFT